MENIAEVLASRQVVTVPVEDRTTQRGEYLREFCERLNFGRASQGLKLITMPRMARLLQGMGCRDTEDIYHLIQKCRGGKSFGGLFWFLYNSQKPKA